MFDIPYCFKNKNENYLVLDSLKKFCKENKLKTTDDKTKLIESIISFANDNEENKLKVAEWLDNILKEGVKNLIILKLEGIRDIRNKNIEEWKSIINNSFNIIESKYLVFANNTYNINLCGYKFHEKNSVINSISFNYTILLKEQKNKSESPQTIIYPIFVDLYLNNGYIIGRGKSKSSIGKFFTENKEIQSTTCEKLIFEAILKTQDALQLQFEDKKVGTYKFKTKIHKMIDECTKTPIEIENRLAEEQEARTNFIKNFFNRQDINLLEGDNFNNASEDLKIFMEKYLSINSTDKTIFTENKYGYPVQIAVTDEDFSSIDESSCDDKPLQCTPIFFDNKKVIQRQKQCDNVSMVFKVTSKPYFQRNNIPVIFIVKKGILNIQFRKYALEEEIENVLSRVIGPNK